MIDQVWIKTRTQDVPADLFGSPRATRDVHPIVALDATHCTQQLGIPGPWCDRLPHFRIDATPSAGDELQSEFFVARDDALEAIDRVHAIGDEIRGVLQISEIRTVAADGLWMSPQNGRDSVGIHFTWTNDPERVDQAVHAVERALATLDVRYHWGKLSHLDASSYERRDDFVELMHRHDARGAFRNAWVERQFGAGE